MIPAVLFLVLLASPAGAHGTLPGGSGFQAGALHPLVATEHLLALLVTGLTLGRTAGGWSIRVGALALLAGIGLGLMKGTLPAPDPVVIVLLAMVLGLLLLSGLELPLGVIAPLVFLLGWAVGSDTDMPADAGVAARLGLCVAAGLIVLNMAALSQWVSGRWPLALRVAGSWFFAIALMVLAMRLVPGTGLVASLP